MNISLYAHIYGSTDSSYKHRQSKIAHGMFRILEIDSTKEIVLFTHLNFRHALLLARRISMKNHTENYLCRFIILTALVR